MFGLTFKRFGGLCAAATALALVATALLLYLGRDSGGVAEAIGQRGQSPPAVLVLALAGLLSTVAIMALERKLLGSADEGSVDAGWIAWAGRLGVVGAILLCIRCVWEAVRYPGLEQYWNTGDPALQASVRAIVAQPSPVDPRGVGSFLLMGLFVLVAGWAMYKDGGPTTAPGLVGIVAGILLVFTFALGLVGVYEARTWLQALSLGIALPVWWLAAGRELLRS